MVKPAKRLLAAIVVLTLLGGALYIYFTPHLTVRQMRIDAEARDAAALSAHIDYPALRDDLRGQIRARIGRQAGFSNSTWGAIGTALAGVLVDPAIDALVTPESLSLMLRGIPASSGNAAPSRGNDAFDARMGYEGPNTFVLVVSAKSTPGLPFGFVLTREGILDWKLTQVRLPAAG